MYRKSNILFILSILLLIGCSKYPKDVLPPDDMENLLYDIYITQSIQGNNSREFEKATDIDALLNYTLEKHDISQAQLDSSLAWYSDNPDLYTKVNDRVIKRFTERRDFYDKIVRTTERSRRTDYLVPPFYYLTSTNSLLSFKLDSLQVEKLGGELSFSFKTLGIKPDMDIYGTVCFEFSDTTLCVDEKITHAKKTYNFKRPYHPLGLVRVFGFIKSDIDTYDTNVLLYDMKIEDKK